MLGNMWAYIYIFQLLLVSTALGLWATHLPRVLLVPRVARFLIGFCLSPYLLGVWMAGFSLLASGAERWLFIVIPVLLSLALIIKYAPKAAKRLRGCLKRQIMRPAWANYVAYGCGLLVLGIVCLKLYVNGLLPVVAHDATFYLREALPFANARDASAINGFRGSLDGSLHGDIHGFLWPAFLSHALVNTNSDVLGFPSDQAARMAFQSTFAFMLLAVVALARTAGTMATGAVALIVLMWMPDLGYISQYSTRDAFRIIPLLTFAALLTGLKTSYLKRKIRIIPLLPVILITVFAIFGHTIGAVVITTTTLAWGVWAYGKNISKIHFFGVFFAIAIGVTLASGQFITAFAETGSITGNNVFSGSVIAGTPLQDEAVKRYEARLGGKTSLAERLVHILGKNKIQLTVFGLVSSIILAAHCIIYRRQPSNAKVFIGLTVLLGMLPFTGIFDFGKYRLSEWFVANFRYPLHWFPFAAVAGAVLLTYVFDLLTEKVRESESFFLRSVVKLLLIIAILYTTNIAITSIKTSTNWDKYWPIDGQIILDYELFKNEYFSLSRRAIENVSAGKRLLTDVSQTHYYVNYPVVILTTQSTKRIIQAKSENETFKALQDLNIGVVALDKSSISGYWDRIPFYKVLENRELFIRYGETARLRVYIVRE